MGVSPMLKNLTLDRPLVVLDLETTGTDTAADRIVEVSTLKLWPGGASELVTRRVDPEVPIPPAATEVHGITDADVAGEPTFRQIAAGLVDFLDGCDLCGFNLLRFDLRLLLAELGRVGHALELDGRRLIDPCAIYHQRERRDLSAALRFYCGAEHDGAHGAEADVLATVAVLDAQAARYEDLPRTTGGLHDACRDPAAVDLEGKFARRPDGVVVVNFGKHAGKPVDDVAATSPGYFRWMLRERFLADAKRIAADALVRVGEPLSMACSS